MLARLRGCQQERSIAAAIVSKLTTNSNVFKKNCHLAAPFSTSALERIRNIGILAHIDAGKTTTTERMLFYSGVIHKMGEVHDGDTTMDYMPQERQRGITIGAAAISFPWRSTNVNVIDTPGHVDFTVEVERAVRVLDGSIAVIDGVAGVEAQTETVWEQANRYAVPRIVFINKMDREGACFVDSCKSLESHFGVKILATQLPYGEGSEFEGIVDLIDMKVIKWVDREGRRMQEYPIMSIESGRMAALYKQALEGRQNLIEKACDYDDELAELYLMDEDIPPEEIRKALRRIVVNRKNASSVVLATCGSALKNKGIQPLLDAIVDYLPSPLDASPFLAQNSGKSEAHNALKAFYIHPEDKDAPLCALAFKVQYDRQRGLIVYFRVYSGVLQSKSQLFNATRNQEERITRLMHVAADDKEEVHQITAGNIGAAIGLKNTFTGDTIIHANHTDLITLPGVQLPNPVFTCSIEAESSISEKELEDALHILQREDPSFVVRLDDETGQTLISGMGELHLDIIKERLRTEYRLEPMIGPMQVAYLESIDQQASTVYTHDTVLGSERQFAQVHVTVEPLKYGPKQESMDCVLDPTKNVLTWVRPKEKDLPKTFLSAIEEGIQSAYSRGVISFHRVACTKITIDIDQCAWDANSSMNAFRTCAAYALKQALREASPTLLEPIMKLQIKTPERCLGDIISDLTSQRRGIVHEVGSSLDHNNDMKQNRKIGIQAHVPLAHMIGYATILRSRTQGEGSFSMEHTHYDKVEQQTLDRYLARHSR
uniref:Elongation factor G putative n=1 Tax=Albugo laibachii Nc14 TaxID=890382 RepID=F0VZW4_9STRA|nr:elongation factor G putative [Albugo laibachii Nc14]|eukprot:CCA14335.1 elongation factor G putative [Albugo laibachii Nc14]